MVTNKSSTHNMRFKLKQQSYCLENFVVNFATERKWIYIFSATTLPVSNNLHKRNLVITCDGRPSRENNAKTTYASNACRARLTPFVPTNGINLQKRICIFLHPRASDAGNLLAKSLAGTSTGSCMDARLQKPKSDLMQRWSRLDFYTSSVQVHTTLQTVE